MENKINLFLQDKALIAELAKDPEVQIKIKNAILEGAIKRTTKLKEGIASQIANELKNELLKPSQWSSYLKDEYKELIKKDAKNAVSELVTSEIKDLADEVRRKTNYYKGLILSKLEDMDIEKIIREEVRKAVDAKFK